ncbi:MAG TPA: c-type cytochrome [Solirubrobacterales bacterium]|nr:c-type cytochrome [Solirubrobacterales bacterium]
MVEAWAFLAVAVIAFVGGLLIGDLASSPGTEVVYVSETEGEETAAAEPGGGGTPEAGGGEASEGAQIFTSTGCGSCHTLAAAGSTGTTGPDLNEFLAPDDTTAGVEEMIVHPNLELAEGYPANVMPQNYGQTLSKAEVQELSEYLVATTPAKP